MKKILAIVVIMTSLSAAQAQEGIRLGLKGSFFSTWLFNKNVSDQNASLDYASSFSPTVGVQGIFMFKETYGMSAEIVYASHVQKYDGYFRSDDNTFTVETKLSYLDIPILFRVSSPKGPYFEIGPQVSLLMGAKESLDFDLKASSDDNYSDKDFKDDFAGFGVAGVLGFGIDIKLSEKVALTTGLRFGYMFTDATAEYSEDELADLEDQSAASYFAQYEAEYSLGSVDSQGKLKNKLDYQKTSRAFGGLQLGLQIQLDKK